MSNSSIRSVLITILFSFIIGCNATKEAEEKSGTIPVGKYGVYYQQKGSGDAVLLIHAGLQNHSMWQKQVEELSKHFKVITIDLPFHGNTTGVDTAILAKDVVKTVLDSLKIEKVSVAGLSMGAAVTQDFIIYYPQRVSKVILMASGIYGYEEAHPVDSVTAAWYPRFADALAKGDTARAALEFARSWGEGVDSRSDSLTKPASRYVYQTTLNTLKQHKGQHWPNLQDSPKAFAGISSLRMPVLIIHGDKDLPFINESSLYLEKNIPGAKRVLLKGVAHMINLEQPAEVNRLMLEFLKQ